MDESRRECALLARVFESNLYLHISHTMGIRGNVFAQLIAVNADADTNAEIGTAFGEFARVCQFVVPPERTSRLVEVRSSGYYPAILVLRDETCAGRQLLPYRYWHLP